MIFFVFIFFPEENNNNKKKFKNKRETITDTPFGAVTKKKEGY